MGSLSGSICGGWQSEKIGRKKSMIVDCFLFITGTIISAVAPNFYLLLFSRWLLGHCSASSMVSAPIYTRGASINYVDMQGEERGSPKCQVDIVNDTT